MGGKAGEPLPHKKTSGARRELSRHLIGKFWRSTATRVALKPGAIDQIVEEWDKSFDDFFSFNFGLPGNGGRATVHPASRFPADRSSSRS